MNTTPSKTPSPIPSAPTSPTQSLVHIGLDVSKDTLDACLLQGDKRHEKQFANDKAAHRSLLAWAGRLAGGVCLEATGSYSQEIALFLVEQAQLVSVINPARIRFFGLARNTGNKTDKADARLIALYCLRQNPPLWNKPPAQVQLLQALVRRLHALNDLLTQEKNRAQVPGQDKILLQSIPGIGQITAWEIMAEMPDVEEFQSAQSAAAYAGLSPRISGLAPACAKRPTSPSAEVFACERRFTFPPCVLYAGTRRCERIMRDYELQANPRWWLWPRV